jgi:hypothetical protein
LQNRIAQPDRWAVGVMAFTDAQADGVHHPCGFDQRIDEAGPTGAQCGYAGPGRIRGGSTTAAGGTVGWRWGAQANASTRSSAMARSKK